MKEFENNIIISFEYQGKTIRQRVDADKIKPSGGSWYFRFWRDGILFVLKGSTDKDGNYRTSGEVDRNGRLSQFYIDTYYDGIRIDDIDIVATDVPMNRGAMYASFRIDYAFEDGSDEGQIRRDILNESSFGATVGSHLPFTIEDFQICGEID